MERGKGNEKDLPGSLQSLRGESEEIYREGGEDLPQAQVTMNAYGQASDGRVLAIVLNFGGLEYMSSSAIGLLVTLLIRVNREKQRLFTYGLSEHYRNILQITRLDDAIGIYDSEEQAVQAADSL